jgi:hypothetical protein
MIHNHSRAAALLRQFNGNLSVLRTEFTVDLLEEDAQSLAIYLSKNCNQRLLTKRVNYRMLARSILCCSVLRMYYCIPKSNLFTCRSTTYLFIKRYREVINLWLLEHGFQPINQHRPNHYSKAHNVTLT